MAPRFDPATAARAVRAYNAETYRGRRNVDVDRAAYDRFRGGLPSDRASLIDCIRFVGEDYGGAQARFLPHGYKEEAALIVANLHPLLDQWQATVQSTLALRESVPGEVALGLLFTPFVGTKRWPVWATKTLHFLRPQSFPILDSRAKIALGVKNLGSTPRDYARFCSTFRECLLENDAALVAARAVDGGESPSDVKLLDKIIYQLGS